jgi:PAS domain S-box-containing protein
MDEPALALLRHPSLNSMDRLRYQELFDFAPVPLLFTDHRGVILEANHAAGSLFDRSKAFLIDKPMGLLLSARFRTRFYECLIGLGRHGGSDRFDSQTARGRDITVAVCATEVYSPRTGTIRWQIEDVTAHRQAEKARADLLLRVLAAQENERRRISREIHDYLGQELTSLTLGLKALETELPDVEAPRQRLRELQEAVGKLGRYAHDLAFDLRPAALDDLGLHAAIDGLVRRWSHRAGISAGFHFAIGGGLRFSAEIESAIFRVIQEALTNVAKHANATGVSVILEHAGSQLMALIEDDGHGFDPDSRRHAPRLGLRGMRERLSLIGGSLQIESSPGAGTTVRARIPCTNMTQDGPR